MSDKQSGNISFAVLVGVVGVFTAVSQFKSVTDAGRTADRNRLSVEMETQAISSLSLYKGLLSANGVNKFTIYPEPYLSLDPKLKKFANQIPGNTNFTAATQTVMVAQPSTRKLDEARLTQIMNGAARTVDVCQGQECAQHSVKLLGYNRDPSNKERIVSADVEVSTQVRDEKNGGGFLVKKILGQVPLEPPKVTSAVLRLSGIQAVSGTESVLASADDNKTQENVTVGVPDLSAELIVGGVAVSGQITVVELEKTFSSDDQDQFGLTADGFPKHGAVTIQNQGTRIVKTPVFQVESGKAYTIVARIQGVDEEAPPPELRLMLNVSLPPPPDASICASKCQDGNVWYDGPFKGSQPGSYSNMIAGKWTCMKHDGCNGNGCVGRPIYSFDPAKNCDIEGPIGFRDSAKGCFAADTEIRMGDGQLKKIQNIKPGDLVWNPALQRSFRVSEVRAGPEQGSLLRLHFGARKQLTVTPDHPFINEFGQVVQAREISAVVNSQGLRLNLRQEETGPVAGTIVYNLQVADEGLPANAHLIEANGIVTGDLYLQNLLKKAPSLTLFDEGRALVSDPNFLALQSEF